MPENKREFWKKSKVKDQPEDPAPDNEWMYYLSDEDEIEGEEDYNGQDRNK